MRLDPHSGQRNTSRESPVQTWIVTLYNLSLPQTHTQELKAGTSHAFLEELILPLRNQIIRGKLSSPPINGHYGDHFMDPFSNRTTSHAIPLYINKSNPCGKDDIMGSILSDASPYLYPFIVEYSLIGAALSLRDVVEHRQRQTDQPDQWSHITNTDVSTDKSDTTDRYHEQPLEQYIYIELPGLL